MVISMTDRSLSSLYRRLAARLFALRIDQDQVVGEERRQRLGIPAVIRLHEGAERISHSLLFRGEGRSGGRSRGDRSGRSRSLLRRLGRPLNLGLAWSRRSREESEDGQHHGRETHRDRFHQAASLPGEIPLDAEDGDASTRERHSMILLTGR